MCEVISSLSSSDSQCLQRICGIVDFWVMIAQLLFPYSDWNNEFPKKKKLNGMLECVYNMTSDSWRPFRTIKIDHNAAFAINHQKYLF